MCSEDNPMVSLKDAKKVISQALQAQRAELLEKLPRKKKIDYSYQNVPEEWRADPDNVENYGYNQCLSEVKKIIKP